MLYYHTYVVVGCVNLYLSEWLVCSFYFQLVRLGSAKCGMLQVLPVLVRN